jgi:hypothetical protein
MYKFELHRGRIMRGKHKYIYVGGASSSEKIATSTATTLLENSPWFVDDGARHSQTYELPF